MKQFILNDETKINSYQFRVLNKTLNLERFKNNPIILDMHQRGYVHGFWKDIKVEGSLLLAIPEFDVNDPVSKKIADKVNRGFLRGASLGLNTANATFVAGADGIFDLLNAEVFEASIVDIPSNPNSLRLYAGEVQLANNDIKNLMLSATNFSGDQHFNLIKTADDFEKLSLDQQKKFYRDHNAQYKALFDQSKGLTFTNASEIKTVDDFEKLSLDQQKKFYKDHNAQYKAFFL